MRFSPKEVLFSPSTHCNLRCEHCAVPQTRQLLPVSTASTFLKDCASHHIEKVGFTGGEVFLHTDFLYPVVKKARVLGMAFTFITTNAQWFKSRKHLRSVLKGLMLAGYDGSFFVSVDHFHKGPVRNIGLFIQEAVRLWRRPDIVSLAYVWGVHQRQTTQRIKKVAALLGLSSTYSLSKGTCCLIDSRKSTGFSPEYCIRTYKIPFSAARGKEYIRDPWMFRGWFKEDYCRGPGNVLFVMADGTVKPCCGYGFHSPMLTIGHIGRDSVKTLLARAEKNSFVQTVFQRGLTSIRKKLSAKGMRFPGKTKDQCYLCEYVLKHGDISFF